MCSLLRVEADQTITVIGLLQSEHFPFLGPNVDISEMKCRTTFYTSMGRLLLVDLGEDEDRFEQFMMPLASNSCLSFQLLFSESAGYIKILTFILTILF